MMSFFFFFLTPSVSKREHNFKIASLLLNGREEKNNSELCRVGATKFAGILNTWIFKI